MPNVFGYDEEAGGGTAVASPSLSSPATSSPNVFGYTEAAAAPSASANVFGYTEPTAAAASAPPSAAPSPAIPPPRAPSALFYAAEHGKFPAPAPAAPTDPNKGAITSGISSAYNGFQSVLANTAAPIEFATAKAIGVPPSTVALGRQAAEQAGAIATNPAHPVANTVGKVGGEAAALVAASVVNPLFGAAVGGAQEAGSGLQESAERGDTAGQTAAVAGTRGAFGAALGLIPGGKTAEGVISGMAKKIGEVVGLNITQAAVDAEVKKAVGVENPGAWQAIKDAATSGETWAQAMLFAGVHAVMSRAGGKTAPANPVEPEETKPATTPPGAAPVASPAAAEATATPPPAAKGFDPNGPPRIPSAFDAKGPPAPPSQFDQNGPPAPAPAIPRDWTLGSPMKTDKAPSTPAADRASLETMRPIDVARYAKSLGIQPRAKADNITAILEKTYGRDTTNPPTTAVPPSTPPTVAPEAAPVPGGNDAHRVAEAAPAVQGAGGAEPAPLIPHAEPTGPAKVIKPYESPAPKEPKTASDMLLRQGLEDGVFPNDYERGQGAIHPDSAKGMLPSQRQGMRGHVNEDAASNETAGMSAEQLARHEAAVVARFGANKDQRIAQAIDHYKGSPDPNLRMMAVQAEAEAEGTGATEKVKPSTFNDGDKFKIGTRPFRVEVDADGNMHFIDDDVEIPHIDPNTPVKAAKGSIERAPEPEVQAGDFAPVENAGITRDAVEPMPVKRENAGIQDKNQPKMPAKTTGSQQSLLGERHEGSDIGSKTGSMFGDVSQGPASKLEETAPKTALEKKFEGTKSGTLPLGEGEHGPGAAGETDPNFIAHTYEQDMGEKSAFRRALESVHDATSSAIIPKLTRAGAGPEAIAHAKARDAVMPKVRDLLAKVFPTTYKDPEAMAKTIDIINKDNILGGYNEFYRRAEEAKKEGKTQQADAWIKKADTVESVHDISAMDAEVQAAKADPAISANVARWKQHVEPVMNRLYNEMKRLDPDQPQEGRGEHFGARINLIDEKHIAAWQEALKDSDKPLPEVGNASSYRNPDVKRDKFDQAASFTGKYATDAETILSAALARRMNETTKLRLIEKLQKQGVAWEDKPGATRPETLKGQPVARMEIRVPQTNPETMQTQMVTRNLWIQKGLVGEARDVLNTDQHTAAPVLQSIGKVLNTIQLAGVVDFTAHGMNLERVVANALGEKHPLTDALKKVPGVGSAAAVARVAQVIGEVYRDTPEIRAEMAKMADAGLLRGYAQHTWWQKTGVALQHMDQASRIVMNRYFDNLVDRGVAKDTPENRFKFVGQAGEYNRRLVGPVTRIARDLGLSPFVVAGRTFNQMGRRWMMGNPGFEATDRATGLKARAMMSAGLVMATTISMMINSVTTGSPMGRPGVPVGAIDTGKNDENGNPKIFDLLQLSGIRRGARSTGIDALIAGLRQGKDWNTIGSNMASDIAQAAMHPWMGPAPAFAVKTATGKQPDLRGKMEAQRIPEGGVAQGVENARAAAESQNPLIYGFLKPWLQKAGIDQTPEKGVAQSAVEGAIKPVAGMLGVKSAPRATDAAEDMAERLARAKFGDRGLTPDDARKVATKQQVLTQLKAGNQGAASDAVDGGKLTAREAAQLTKKAGMSSLAWNVKSLSADDAVRVYNAATPAEKELLHDAVRDHIVKSDKTPEEQDKLMATAGITPPKDLALDREHAELAKKATADEKRQQQLESLGRQIAAAEQAKDWAKGAALRQERLDVARQPKQLQGAERARYEQLQQYRAARGKVQQMVKEGSMQEDSADRRLAGLRGRLGG